MQCQPDCGNRRDHEAKYGKCFSHESHSIRKAGASIYICEILRHRNRKSTRSFMTASSPPANAAHIHLDSGARLARNEEVGSCQNALQTLARNGLLALSSSRSSSPSDNTRSPSSRFLKSGGMSSSRLRSSFSAIRSAHS